MHYDYDTCVEHRDHHHGRDEDVDGEGCNHLLDCAPESYLVLLDCMDTIVPIGVWRRIIYILDDVDQFVCEVTLSSKLRGC